MTWSNVIIVGWGGFESYNDEFCHNAAECRPLAAAARGVTQEELTLHTWGLYI